MTGKQFFRIRFSICVLAMAACMTSAHAASYIDQTRVIISAQQPVATPRIANSGTEPLLFQAWIDRGDQSTALANLDVPFVLDPPLFRLDPGKARHVRIMLDPKDLSQLPTHQEAIFWLNLLEILGTRKTNADGRLQIAFQSRIKLFYRPEHLTISPDDARSMVKLEWHCSTTTTTTTDARVLVLNNPTPYFQTVLRIEALNTEGFVQSGLNPTPDLLPPGGSFTVPWAASSTHLRYWLIDDFGEPEEHGLQVTLPKCD